jgi:hypothetical protein
MRAPCHDAAALGKAAARAPSKYSGCSSQAAIRAPRPSPPGAAQKVMDQRQIQR